ncbi:MAG: aspartate dehydrogenase [Aestuariivita sp.]|nr:aspartate dehydrogenase [Aestuariivita sp.]MCY4345738.1 aspartate dehydrogenase [Aestuariivita sp.]
MQVAVIGTGAIATFVADSLRAAGFTLAAKLVRAEKARPDANHYGSVASLPRDLDIVIDCAGHEALRMHGPQILAGGIDLITVSLGALADSALAEELRTAAQRGGAKLHLASGAIGALDCLQAARVGALHSVVYTGRKPPKGWKGSAAELVMDLDALTHGAITHFDGSARDAALRYPKNANVAAAVALAGVGFDKTKVKLIADANATENIHEFTAQGDFGQLQFRVNGSALPDNPRSSALAAMSVVAKIQQLGDIVSF